MASSSLNGSRQAAAFLVHPSLANHDSPDWRADCMHGVPTTMALLSSNLRAARSACSVCMWMRCTSSLWRPCW